jgi:hypothetical protein
VSDSGETLVDNGNGTKTDSQGNLVVETGEGTKIYAPVKSDVPGIYLDEAGEIVYTGADGIPDTDDDDVFVVPDYPLPIQKTLFSRIYPMAVLPDGEYQMKLAFADGHAYPGSYTGKIKFMSNDPDIIAIDENGLMKASSTGGQSTAITIILEDGSILSASTSIHPTKTLLDGYKLAGVLNTDVILTEGMIGKVTALRRAVDGSQNAHNTTDLSYSMADDGDTDSSVTPGGWFHAGSAGKATVTATATDDAGNTFTGTITVTILGEPSEEIDYETASTDWADLEPAPAYAGGDGTEAGPYQVSSVRQLKKLAVDIELLGSTEVTYQKYFELTADLDFSADNTVKSTLIGAFYGTFDGKGHVIKDLHIDATGRSSVSLFAGLTYGEIKNLGREGGSITGNNTAYASGLVLSVNKKGKLKNCYNSSSINILTFAGGLVNSTSGNDIIIENCYNTGEITVATEGAAGLNGTCLWNGGSVTIINSYNTGRIKSQYAAGSLMYELNNANGNEQTVTLNNVFNFGDMNITNLENRIGSLIGYIYSSSSGEVYATNVYSKPDVASVREVIKSNQPIGWGSTTFRDAVLAANPTLGENSKYTTEYSQSPAFATELGDAFKYVPGRTPKLAWEK